MGAGVKARTSIERSVEMEVDRIVGPFGLINNKIDADYIAELRAKGGQRKLHSALETALNIGSGFVISWCMWTFVVGPLWSIPFHIGDSLGITALFTVTSVARSYLWRRYFNGRIINS